METNTASGGVPPAGDSTELLAEFARWLDRERGLSAESVRCYSNQAGAFLAGTGGAGAVGSLSAGRVTAFMVDWSRDRNSWSAKAMVTSLRALPAVRPRDRQDDGPAGGSGPVRRVVEEVGATAGAEGSRDRAAAGRVRPGDGDRAAGLCDLVAAGPARPAGAEAAALQLGDIDWRAGEITVTGKGSRSERLPLPAPAGEAIAAWLERGRPECESRAVFVGMRRPYRQVTPSAVRAVMGYACDRAGMERRGSHRFRHALATEMLQGPARRCPRSGRSSATGRCCRRRFMPRSIRTRCGRWPRPWPGSMPG